MRMLIKNIGGKIINIGHLSLLPGEFGITPLDFYENNAVIDRLVAMGLVSLEEINVGFSDAEHTLGTGGEQKPDDTNTEPDPDNEDGAENPPAGNEQKPGRGGRRATK